MSKFYQKKKTSQVSVGKGKKEFLFSLLTSPTWWAEGGLRLF